MNLPQNPPNDRRAVPRHIRDGEHDAIDDALTVTAPAARTAIWLLAGIGVLAAIGIVWWFTRG